MSHLAVIISTIPTNDVDDSASPLTFFHAVDAAINAVHVNTTINTGVFLNIPHQFGPFIHYLTVYENYFSNLFLIYILAPITAWSFVPSHLSRMNPD
jgi:hypothetical protein